MIRRYTEQIADQQLELATIELKKTLAEILEAEKLIGEGGKAGPEGAVPPNNGPLDLRKTNEAPEYVVEPPDVITIEVAEALEGRPITGDRLVRPDGKISLGLYGDVYVAGLTTSEIKEKVILHLRAFLDDKTLGLTRNNPVTLKLEQVDPSQTNRVVVRLAEINRKVYWVQGNVDKPGKFPCSGNETVLDAINLAGGLTPDGISVRLIRKDPVGNPVDSDLPVDYAAIVTRGDTTTNYRLEPGDRLVVTEGPAATVKDHETRKTSPASPIDARTSLRTLGHGLEELLQKVERSSEFW